LNSPMQRISPQRAHADARGDRQSSRGHLFEVVGFLQQRDILIHERLMLQLRVSSKKSELDRLVG
jgi:hypothetical protein